MNNIDDNKIQGIIDMELFNENPINRYTYLDSAIDILKEMITFHIDAVTRLRYERAADYSITSS